LREEDPAHLDELWRRADDVRRRHVGDEVHLRGLIEISNVCVRECLYCGLRASNRGLARYRMTADEILAAARQAAAFRYGTVVLQSGEDYGIEAEWLAGIIHGIKATAPLAVTLSLGERDVPADALYGVHTERAIENFPLAGRPVHPALVHAFGAVKLACARTNHELGRWDDAKFRALEAACMEMMEGMLDRHIVVDALRGGAGTSTNMNVNEVLANRALQILGRPLGDYATLDPVDDVNLHQSTNDTYPTALRVAAIGLLRNLEREVVALLEEFQRREKEMAGIVKVGRTQFQDAVLTTLGRVKIPRWLTQYVGGKLEFTSVQGHDFPDDVTPYKLIVHCGACMWNRREMLSRLIRCRKAGVPITNYGLTIAYSLGIFERALGPFPAALEAYREWRKAR
jgi:hypothetical protein